MTGAMMSSADQMQSSGALLRIGGGAGGFNWLPVIAADPDGLVETLRRHGFDATRGATSLRAFTSAGARASHLVDHIVYPPHPADMAARDRIRLIEALLGALG